MSQIDLVCENHIAVLTLNNPAKLNCLTVEMLADMNAHLDRVERDPSIGVLIVTGAGERAFCTGADITAWGDLEPAEFARHWVRDGHRVFDRLARFAIPTIGALNGHAMGGGLELASACDIRVMTPKARLALPEASIGIVPGWSGTQRLARLIPEAMLKEMALLGVQITADRAYAANYVARVCDDVMADAMVLAEQALTLSPSAVEINKRMILAAKNEDRDAMIEALGSAAVAVSQDRVEGVRAFKEKRKPKFVRT